MRQLRPKEAETCRSDQLVPEGSVSSAHRSPRPPSWPGPSHPVPRRSPRPPSWPRPSHPVGVAAGGFEPPGSRLSKSGAGLRRRVARPVPRRPDARPAARPPTGAGAVPEPARSRTRAPRRAGGTRTTLRSGPRAASRSGRAGGGSKPPATALREGAARYDVVSLEASSTSSRCLCHSPAAHRCGRCSEAGAPSKAGAASRGWAANHAA
jgi:hypothetical protein